MVVVVVVSIDGIGKDWEGRSRWGKTVATGVQWTEMRRVE